MWTILKQINAYLRPVLHSYSEIIFLRHYLTGLLLFALTFINPQQGTAGLIAIISAFAFAKFMGFHTEFLRSGYYTYNHPLTHKYKNMIDYSYLSELK